MGRPIRFPVLSVLVCFGALLLSGDNAAAAGQITFTDALNKSVTVNVPAQRIVVLNSDAAEVLYVIGASDRIVGVSNHIAENRTGLMDGLEGKQVVGSPQSPNMEKIAELSPDLVISYEMWLTEAALEEKLAPLGIPVARIPCYRIDDLEAEIRLLGRISGLEAAAEAYAAACRALLDRVAERVKGIERPARIYCEGYGDFATVTNKSGASQMLAAAGVCNIAAELPAASPEISAEWVVVQNPEVIIKAASAAFVKTGFNVTDTQSVASLRERIMARSGWHQVDAVRENRVFIISHEIWCGPMAPVGILYFAKWCYPDLFAEVDLETVHREWLERWYQKPLCGVYVYPE